MPTTPTFTWNPASRLDPIYDAEDATELDVNLQGVSATASMLYPRGMVLGEVAAAPGVYGQYISTNSDGTQTAKMILRYNATVLGALGAAGAITWVGGEWGPTAYSPIAVPAFKSGDFLISQLVGLDATAVTNMAGHIVTGGFGTNEVDSLAGTATGGTGTLTIPALTVGGVVYPSVTTGTIAATAAAAAVATAINAALSAAGIPGYVTTTGGALGTAPVVITFLGAAGATPIVLVANTGSLTGGTWTVTRSTQGVASTGIVRFG